MEKPAEKKAPSVDTGAGKVKMVQRHPEFQESDTEANQAESDANRFTGSNPYPAGSARAQGWAYLKQMTK
jgi:hypothetical protein